MGASNKKNYEYKIMNRALQSKREALKLNLHSLYVKVNSGSRESVQKIP